MPDLLCLLLALPLIVATGIFATEAWGGVVTARGDGPPLPPFDPAAVVVLVPAHDEARGIGAVLARMRAGMPAGMRLLVIADNCTDDTAAIARTAGAEVVERFDTARRGKGFALDHGRATLSVASPACVIVVDADTVPEAGALARLAARAIASGQPVQSAYTIDARDEKSSIARFSAAAFYVKNAVRQLGAARIGAPAVLTGSGMAFPWPIFARLPLATGHVAEDLMLGVESALAGRPPLFDPRAVVLGTASSDKGTAVQRRRWESGFFQVASDSAGALLARGIARGRFGCVWLGLHLLTPPLIPLIALDTLAVAALALVWLFTGIGEAALAVLAGLTAAAVLAVPVALASHKRLFLLDGWHAVPRYMLWKIGLTLAALLRREKAWIRTDRD
ncbi:glycosyl transferase [Sphingomonas metalli]|uniref:Glycosyl transferase n=1 Tax=Sphingomonas metalli TaxID=1779358 RepID=A0A916WVG0_9SPHN|nr:glycosyltransferase family 2 protein [Sphingomonas metalli]GGB37155.1 glycosyl transferase [Sphingomonas metalli]